MIDAFSDRHIYSVTELTNEIKNILDENFQSIWIEGEISGLSLPASGHCYFTLKDRNAQISSVIFKGQKNRLKFNIENGLSVNGFGRVNVYEPRGTYQIIFEHIEPKGIGSLQVAFEQLKKKLFDEGLFDDKYKKVIPLLPKKISCITSPTGAVIHDIIHIISRRFPNVHIEILPVKVQGENAEHEICHALDTVNKINSSDVIIIARGGGSLEDLYPFNTEHVARSVFRSEIPVISAVGHETDFTICDFASNLRAPTPSAAAELVLPEKSELIRYLRMMKSRLINSINMRIRENRSHLNQLEKRIVHPLKKLQESQLRQDDLTGRMQRAMKTLLKSHQEKLSIQKKLIHINSPLHIISELRQNLFYLTENCKKNHNSVYLNDKLKYKGLVERLQSLNPEAVLDRGYSIAKNRRTGEYITDIDNIHREETIDVILSEGSLECKVKGKKHG